METLIVLTFLAAGIAHTQLIYRKTKANFSALSGDQADQVWVLLNASMKLEVPQFREYIDAEGRGLDRDEAKNCFKGDKLNDILHKSHIDHTRSFCFFSKDRLVKGKTTVVLEEKWISPTRYSNSKSLLFANTTTNYECFCCGASGKSFSSKEIGEIIFRAQGWTVCYDMFKSPGIYNPHGELFSQWDPGFDDLAELELKKLLSLVDPLDTEKIQLWESKWNRKFEGYRYAKSVETASSEFVFST